MAKRVRTYPKKAKHWCYTINNPTEADKSPDDEMMAYHVCGMETGEDGTPHYQGYMCFKNRQTMTALKKIMPRAHLEVMRGTPQEASDYCKKDGEFLEMGTLPASQCQAGGAKNKERWIDAYDKAKKGDLEEIPKDMLIRHYHAFKRIRQDNPTKLDSLPKTCGIWYHGPTGCGKSKTARETYPDYYDKPLNKWWDGYRDQPYVILDDVGPDQGQWIGTLMKRWTDHYPFPAEQKGTTVQIRPKNIIVTSQYTIEEVFHQDDKLQDALTRRFHVINMYNKGDNPFV